MALTRFTLSNFRNLVSVDVEPLSVGFNYIFGNNGSGKTSLLEAIYYLALGRSFRSSQVNRVISYNASKLALFGEIMAENAQTIPLGLEKTSQSDVKIRIAGRNASSIAEIAHLLPIQIINSNSYTLLEAPHFRRKYLDWGAFYSNPQFLMVWKDYQRVLKQRNAALRSNLSIAEIAIWTKELVEPALSLDKMRKEYVADLSPLLKGLIEELLSIDNVQVEYQQGWDSKLEYGDFMAQTMDKDRQASYTQNGPHRADFKILIKGVPAKDILSRGQQKLFVCAMIVAQGTLLHNYMNKKPIYLVDDLPSELDSISRSRLLSLLSKQSTQIFVTAVEQQILEEFLKHHPTKMFHVEHGRVDEVKEETHLL